MLSRRKKFYYLTLTRSPNFSLFSFSILRRLRHPRCLDQNIVEDLLFTEWNDLIHKIWLKSAAKASILHGNNLITLNQGRLIYETLVNVEGSHIVDNDGTFETFLCMLGLKNVLQHGCLASSKEPTQQRHWQEIFWWYWFLQNIIFNFYLKYCNNSAYLSIFSSCHGESVLMELVVMLLISISYTSSLIPLVHRAVYTINCTMFLLINLVLNHLETSTVVVLQYSDCFTLL